MPFASSLERVYHLLRWTPIVTIAADPLVDACNSRALIRAEQNAFPIP